MFNHASLIILNAAGSLIALPFTAIDNAAVNRTQTAAAYQEPLPVVCAGVYFRDREGACIRKKLIIGLSHFLKLIGSGFNKIRTPQCETGHFTVFRFKRDFSDSECRI